MGTAVAAPVIEAEMKDWTSLGGGNSGIVGDQNHTYGFHCSANNVPPSDYSRSRDPNGSDGPYVNWNYCCAGDFDHKNDSKLRKMHANVLNELMDGKYPMICEFIGKPWADKPVYYWARWNGIGTLQKYTGQGHDHWSHISWYRSRVDERAYLWVAEDMADATVTGITKDGFKDLMTTDDGIPNLPWRKDYVKFDAPEGAVGPQGGTNRFIMWQTWFDEMGQETMRQRESLAAIQKAISEGIQIPALVQLDPDTIDKIADKTADELRNDPERDGADS